MSMIQPMLGELEQEAATTRRHFEAIPKDKLTWKPHAHSWTLGQIANHIATLPGNIADLIQMDAVPAPDFAPPEQPTSSGQLIETLNAGIAKVNQQLSAMSDEQWGSSFRVMKGDKAVMDVPKIAVARVILLNHMYHHRGQLALCLRMLGTKVPATYGNSADENPFA